MAQSFLTCDREQSLLLPPDMREWLDEDRLAWFVIKAVDELDLEAFYSAYRADGHGHAAHEPKMMVSLLAYSYAVGERFSRGIERRCREDVAFRVICANQAPDHATIARFRVRHGEIAELVEAKAPELVSLPGCGPLTAAKVLSETAGVERFGSHAKLARLAGVAPIPVSSGRRDRHRLDRGGNRQLNCAFHRIAVTQIRMHEPARAYVARKQAEGKNKREALRYLKRQIARAVWQALRDGSSSAPPSLPDFPKLRPVGELALT